MSAIIQRDKNRFFWKVYFRFISLPRYLFRYYFKFYPFNLIPTQSKQYCIDIINHLIKRQLKRSVVEIGCGLGDILRNIDFEKKLGYDKQIEVLNALNFINRFYIKKSELNYTNYSLEKILSKGNTTKLFWLIGSIRFQPIFYKNL